MPLMALEPDHDPGTMLITLAFAEGSASHPYTHSFALNAGPLATRNVADALHLLSILHGAQHGLVERAGERNVLREANAWYARAAEGFARERAYLAHLAVAAGPAPGTHGEAESNAAVQGSRHALETIAASERFGCALGATAALVLDWRAIRSVLDVAAERLGLKAPPCRLPDEDATAALLDRLPPQPRLDRTLAFGARQLLDQHRGLWDLLEARADVRNGD